MKHISNISIPLVAIQSKSRAVPRQKTERGELLEGFLEKVNGERKGTKYKPMTIKLLAIKLSHIPTKDLYYLQNICKDYEGRNGSYSKCLFGSIKGKA